MLIKNFTIKYKKPTKRNFIENWFIIKFVDSLLFTSEEIFLELEKYITDSWINNLFIEMDTKYYFDVKHTMAWRLQKMNLSVRWY